MMELRGKIEIENPSYKVGDVVKVKFLAIHPMDTGFAVDKASGATKPANYLKSLKVLFNDTEIASFEIEISTSQNPRIIFPYKITGKGVLKAVVENNNGEKAEKTFEVTPK
jgi:sulfur-oxidizing protein SoxZ